MILIEPSRDGLIERGRFEQPDRINAPAWAHPIIANGKLYVRDQDLLLCYDVHARKDAQQTSNRSDQQRAIKGNG